MIFLIYTILVILQQYKGMTTVVGSPCPSTIVDTIVADMCTSSSATEETRSGGNRVDSVVLRIMTQQDDCICRVTITNQIQPIYVGLRKYDGLSSSAPKVNRCGLAVDINHTPNISTGNVIAPIECITGVAYRTILLLPNNALQFKSRIINGNFTRGYCMRIQRDISSNHSQVLRIDCDAHMTTELTTEQIKTSDSTKNFPQTTEYVKSTTKNSDIEPTTTAPTTDTSTNVNYQQMTTAADPTTGIEQTTYIAIGAGSGVALILLVVLVVICIRKKSTQKAETNGNVNTSYQQDESDDKLQENVLYVPATEFDITGDNYSRIEGNYSTVDEDIRKSSNEIFSMEDNYETVELVEHMERNCSYPVNSELGQTKGKQTPTIKPTLKSSCINREENRPSDQNKAHFSSKWQ